MNSKKLITALLILIAAFAVSTSFAKNLGVWGAVFTIEEQDLKEFILGRLNQMQQSGELEKLKTTFIKSVKQHILRPAPLAGITTTDNPKTFYYDPTHVLTKNIEDHKGKIIAKAGTTINPFNTITLHSVWLFIDADDIKQTKWALASAKKYSYVKYILVRGNIKDASKTLNNKIYFDQSGVITKQLGIKHVPSVVKQEGKKLQIQEISSEQICN